MAADAVLGVFMVLCFIIIGMFMPSLRHNDADY